MEHEPSEGKEGLGYEAALTLARSDQEGWGRAQSIALETHLLRASELQPDEAKRKIVQDRIKELGSNYSALQELLKLGEEQNLLADFDLEREAVKLYCDQRNIELSSDF
jgi:hypothetical protein